MQPKEKAEELVLKYEQLLFNRFTTDDDWAKCVECALISINEILNLCWNGNKIAENYWHEVKKEIENL